MSASERAEGGRAEPIDVDFEPADRFTRPRRPPQAGVSVFTALALAVTAAAAGAVGGAIAPRAPQVKALLDQAFPQEPAARPPTAPQPVEGPAQTELAARITALETALQALEAQEPPLEQVDLVAQVSALQSSLSDLAGRLEGLPSPEEIATLTAGVQQVQAALPALNTRLSQAETASRAAFAVAAAAEAARSSGAFEDAHAALAGMLPNNPDVAALAPLAQSGAPTRMELRDRFSALEVSILRAAAQSRAGAGLWGRLQAAAADWITVRRVGEGDTPAGVVERAAQRLAVDDLQGAISEASRLTGAAGQVAAPWLEQARRRLEIDVRLAAIRAELAGEG